MIYILPVLAVLLSYGIVVLVKPKKKDALRLLLAFSGAFLLSITIFELFPRVYQNSDPRTIGIFIMLGILLQIFLEFFSKGAEHGHIHMHAQNGTFPWLLFISLSIHAFLEGIPIEEGGSILYGILIHKVPIALILSIFLVGSKINLLKGIVFMVLFAAMTPLGTYAAANSDIVTRYYVPITALVIGVFLHISTVILFESSEGHTFNFRKLFVIILGITIAYVL